jgi:hypothetical protein
LAVGLLNALREDKSTLICAFVDDKNVKKNKKLKIEK